MNKDVSTGNNPSLPVLKIGKHTPRFPVVQGGMGIRVSAHRLAGAVAKAGGVGTIASVALGLASKHYTGKNYFEANKMALTDELTWARQAAPDGILAVNNMVAITDYEDMVRTSAESGANVIICGAGLPMQLPEFTKDFPDVALVPIVSSVKAARLIVRKWEKAYGRIPDAFVMEAPSTAGGHLGAKPEEVYSPEFTLEAVVPELVEYIASELKVDIPVIAAGGIWSREDMLAAFALGAKGVQMGTRFVCTFECDADDAFKQMYLDATEKDVELIKSPVGLPGRAIHNKFLEDVAIAPPAKHKCIANCLKHCGFKVGKQGFCIATALSAAHKGDIDHGLVFSGSNAPLCTRIVTVEDIFADLFPG
ncbi:MAG: nitronate monooxygenase [Nitrospirae bacterium]|nr:nitronate monooxygenase [Nitrospirota bacterium]